MPPWIPDSGVKRTWPNRAGKYQFDQHAQRTDGPTLMILRR
jgi:hypothetical protein